MTINTVAIGGRLGAKPMLSEFPNGDVVTHFAIAHSRYVGPGKYETDWHNCEAKSHVAQRLCELAMKGQGITVQGKLRVKTFDDTAKGVKVVVVDIIVLEFALGELPRQSDQKSD